MKVPAGFIVLSLALVAALSVCSSFAAPTKKDLLEAMEFKGEKETMSMRHHQTHHFQPSKDTYALLRSLRKIQGQDGRSPVCKICNTQNVDANTYDYFCLPDSDGMDGEICDRLTILGTTQSHRINVGCKMLLSRHTTMCK